MMYLLQYHRCIVFLYFFSLYVGDMIFFNTRDDICSTMLYVGMIYKAKNYLQKKSPWILLLINLVD